MSGGSQCRLRPRRRRPRARSRVPEEAVSRTLSAGRQPPSGHLHHPRLPDRSSIPIASCAARPVSAPGSAPAAVSAPQARRPVSAPPPGAPLPSPDQPQPRLPASPSPGSAAGLQRLSRAPAPPRRAPSRSAAGADLRRRRSRQSASARISLDLARGPAPPSPAARSRGAAQGVARRRSDAAPALPPRPHAVLRHPGRAAATPRSQHSTTKPSTSGRSKSAPWPTQKSASVLSFSLAPPAQPARRRHLLLAEPRQLARAAHPFDRRVEPERSRAPEDRPSECPGPALHRSDHVVERRRVEALEAKARASRTRCSASARS